MKKLESLETSVIQEVVNLNDTKQIEQIFKKFRPDVIVHCAGIAHQKIGAVGSEEYFRENSLVTENLAKIGIRYNPDLYFVFMSSISVYGEKITENNSKTAECRNLNFNETDECHPSSDYARSKLDAEKRLAELHSQNSLKYLTMLRLAPVYDSEWTLSLDRRVYLAGKKVFVKFGSGKQKMSALSRRNLVDFVDFIVGMYEIEKQWVQNMENRIGIKEFNSIKKTLVINVCDNEPYSFSMIISVFKKYREPNRKPTINFPLPLVWVFTRFLGLFLIGKKEWLHSCYDKLANDLVFNTTKMKYLGFKHGYTLNSIFSNKN